jgi:hypothetical protein
VLVLHRGARYPLLDSARRVRQHIVERTGHPTQGLKGSKAKGAQGHRFPADRVPSLTGKLGMGWMCCDVPSKARTCAEPPVLDGTSSARQFKGQHPLRKCPWPCHEHAVVAVLTVALSEVLVVVEEEYEERRADGGGAQKRQAPRELCFGKVPLLSVH